MRIEGSPIKVPAMYESGDESGGESETFIMAGMMS